MPQRLGNTQQHNAGGEPRPIAGATQLGSDKASDVPYCLIIILALVYKPRLCQ